MESRNTDMLKSVPENTELAYKDASELASLIRKKALSAKELMLAYLSRQKAIHPRINAIISSLAEEEALKMADAADLALSKGENIGPLHGIPLACKEMLAVKGWEQTYCWKAGIEAPELAAMDLKQKLKEDGLLARRMRKAGLLFVGKTNMPEFAFGSHTVNDLYGNTLNPYNRRKTAGGSSGGAAAALAAGIVSLADGSDLGGSLRNPASFCNVIGFRPSIGRIPLPDSGWAARMGTQGPMARSVRDIALLLSIQAGPDRYDPVAIPESGQKFGESLKKDLTGLKVGFTLDFGLLPVQEEVKNVVRSALSHFQDIGMELREEYPKVMHKEGSKGELDAMEVFRILRVVNISGNIMAFHSALGEKGIRRYMRPVTQYQMLDAFHAVDAKSIYLANENRHRIYQLFMDYFETHDFLVCPSAQVLPFDIEADYVREIEGKQMHDYLEWMSICCIISIMGFPVISMPCGFSKDGLPVGLQIIGKPGADLAVLQVAQAFEAASQVSAKFNPPDLSL